MDIIDECTVDFHRHARFGGFHNCEQRDYAISRIFEGHRELFTADQAIHKDTDAFVSEALGLTKDLVLNDYVRNRNLRIGVFLDHIMVGRINGDHAFIAEDIELDVVYAGIGVGRNPTVFHLSDRAIFKFNGRQIFIDGIGAFCSQYALFA